ncbi:MAG: hypothetical protein KJ587_09095 [Alphaproteobacteria bacterium]|nr:hypothetical protein [Alphaproteobacteria bacterium]
MAPNKPNEHTDNQPRASRWTRESFTFRRMTGENVIALVIAVLIVAFVAVVLSGGFSA